MRQYEGWDTALDHQTDLIRQATTREGRGYLDGFAESMAKNGSVINPETGERENDDEERGYQLVQATTYMLPEAEPIYVAPDICDLINYAADTFKPEPFLETDLLTPAGFVYFGNPLQNHDTHGRLMNHRAMMWCVTEHQFKDGSPASRGVVVAFYSHRLDPDPYWDERDEKMGVIGGSDLTLAHVTSFTFGIGVHEVEDISVLDVIRHLNVFFRLCQQEIAVPHHERVGRPVWKRASTWRQIKEVKVFTLRRAKPSHYEGEEREVEWSHRWMVSGHWRNQPYVERDEDGEKITVHRQIWIAPYVKGPDGKPLIFKRRAFELIR